ncbi:MAG: helix-turn-helix domain-containing protein [Dehalococcoidia bacterium]|nr:helix-turn-helix domain-containing protein [Dehalococcoidia bacterium]
MLATCPSCGGKVPRPHVGHPRLLVPVQNVLDALARGLTVAEAASHLGISRASVYRLRDMGGLPNRPPSLPRSA